MSHQPDRSITLRLRHHELVIRQRYEVASIINDIMIAAWFIAGSIMYFTTSLATAGTWCFLAGSVQLLIRPMIRLVRLVHLTRLSSGYSTHETGLDS